MTTMTTSNRRRRSQSPTTNNNTQPDETEPRSPNLHSTNSVALNWFITLLKSVNTFVAEVLKSADVTSVRHWCL